MKYILPQSEGVKSIILGILGLQKLRHGIHSESDLNRKILTDFIALHCFVNFGSFNSLTQS